MKERTELSCRDLRELAPSYALGALDAGERDAFEKHLRSGCQTCEAEWRSFEAVGCEFMKAVAQEPPRGMRQRLLEKVADAPRVPGIILDRGGVLVSRPDELEWQPLAPGVAYKLLSRESERRYNTCLVRMDAGAHFPGHRHADVEELFLLSGDLHLGADVMRAGDYCRAEAGSVHDQTFTVSGCVFLVRASHRDELLQ